MTTEQKPQSPIAQFRGLMEGGMRAEIKKALPPDIDPDRFIRTTITAVQMNPDLLGADRRSLMASCMRAAQDGLLPDGREAVLNIYNTKVKNGNREEWVPTVQYLPMVRGILKTLRNSGEIAHLDAAAVYEKDAFRFVRGDKPSLEHEPYLGEDEPGKIVAAYIVVRMNNGEVHREVMPRRDIEKTRDASKSGNGASSPWTKWYDQMAIKSVIKRAAKLLPTSSDRLDRLIENDNEAMGFEGFNQRGVDAAEITQQPTTSSAPALTDERTEQGRRRPSRMAGIVDRARTAETVPVSPAREGLPASEAPSGELPWHDEEGEVMQDNHGFQREPETAGAR